MLAFRSNLSTYNVICTVNDHTLIETQSKYNMEVSSLREHLEESERKLRTNEMDMAALREKLDKVRIDSIQVKNHNFKLLI